MFLGLVCFAQFLSFFYFKPPPGSENTKKYLFPSLVDSFEGLLRIAHFLKETRGVRSFFLNVRFRAGRLTASSSTFVDVVLFAVPVPLRPRTQADEGGEEGGAPAARPQVKEVRRVQGVFSKRGFLGLNFLGEISVCRTIFSSGI